MVLLDFFYFALVSLAGAFFIARHQSKNNGLTFWKEFMKSFFGLFGLIVIITQMLLK
jgi:hypothetical protein